MTRINVKYAGGFNPELDDEIERTVGKESVSTGFFIPTGERDMQFDVDDAAADLIIERVRAMGIIAEREKPRAVQ